MVLLYMVTGIPSIYPSHVSIYIPAPWIRHGIWAPKIQIYLDSPGWSCESRHGQGFWCFHTASTRCAAMAGRQWSHNGGRGWRSGNCKQTMGPWMIGGPWNSRNFKAWQLCDFRWCILSSWPWFKRTRWAVVFQPQMMIFGDTPVENHRWLLEKCYI